jgi:hypothetical protein
MARRRSCLVRASGVLSLVSCLVVASCGPGEPRGARSPSLSARPSRSAGTDTAAKQAALTAYRGMWTALVDASKTSDPDAPDLRKYAQGQALKLIVSGLYTNHTQGRVAKGHVVLHPQVTQATPAGDPTQVSVSDCVDATNWLDYKTSGELWNNEPGGKHQASAVVNRTEGSWRVDSFSLKDKGTC